LRTRRWSPARLLAETEGILTETAGGVTVAALQSAIASGVVTGDDEVVIVISGNGLKTLDAFGDRPRQPIEPSFAAFEAAWAQHDGIGPAGG
jgi:threonine synthase